MWTCRVELTGMNMKAHKQNASKHGDDVKTLWNKLSETLFTDLPRSFKCQDLVEDQAPANHTAASSVNIYWLEMSRHSAPNSLCQVQVVPDASQRRTWSTWSTRSGPHSESKQVERMIPSANQIWPSLMGGGGGLRVFVAIANRQFVQYV